MLSENKIDIATWLKAEMIWLKAKKDGIVIGRAELAKLLNIGERRSSQILFALNNRDVIVCKSAEITSNAGDVELACGDLHFPYQDDAAISAMISYAKNENVNIITINGDLLDCYQISSFTKNPLRSKRLFDEIAQVKKWLHNLRELFPSARIIFKQGNHEKRIEKYILDKAPALAELLDTFLIDKLELSKLNIEYIIEPFKIGNLWHLHGDEKPGGSYNPEYITNVLMQYIYDHFIVFHYHRTQDKLYPGIGGRCFKASSVGHLAGSFEYAQLNKWNQGFAIIKYDEHGDFTIDNKTIINGIIY